MSQEKPETIDPGEISLFLSDVDGSLITPDRQLTRQACRAVEQLKKHGVAFTVVSGRPPKGLRAIISELGLTLPLAAFNGGMIVRPDLSVIEEHLLDAHTAGVVIDTIQSIGADAWLYRGTEWFVRDARTAHALRESTTVGFDPIVAREIDSSSGAVKIVAIADDPQLLSRCQRALNDSLSGRVSDHLSQPYYLDITHPKANKGEVVHTLSRLLSIPSKRIGTLGDMANDILMFKESGVSIAMGNATPEVQKAARFRTRRNDQDGFAFAVESIVLQRSLHLAHAG